MQEPPEKGTAAAEQRHAQKMVPFFSPSRIKINDIEKKRGVFDCVVAEPLTLAAASVEQWLIMSAVGSSHL